MLHKFLNDNKSNFYFVFRLIVGLMFALNGATKLGLMGGSAQTGLLLLAGIIELVVGIAITLGAYVEIAAVLGGLELIYAFVSVHLPNGLNPLVNGGNNGETALLYVAAFLVLAAYGGGKWTIGNPGKK